MRSARRCNSQGSMKNVFANEAGGVALVLVIWVLVVLVAIVGEFSYSMRTEINITRNFKEEQEAYQLALSGVEQAKLELLSVKEEEVVYLEDENVLKFGDEEDEGELLFQRKVTLGKGEFTYDLIDEDRKLDINTAERDQLVLLFHDSGVDMTDVDEIVDSILDWRDANDLHMLNGAEEEYYQSLDRPYSCKDGDFDSIDELLLVKGISRDILYGSKKDSDDEGTDSDDEETYEGVEKYLTVYGTERLNINTASDFVLSAVFTPADADQIISRRADGPLKSATQHGKVTSEIFTIISTGTNSDGTIKRSVKTVVHRMSDELEILYWNDNFIG